MTSRETEEALLESAGQIVEGVRRVLETTPPELSADIAMRGILLTGGGNLIYGMDELIQKATGIHTATADDPMSVVAIGTGRYAEFLEGKNQVSGRG